MNQFRIGEEGFKKFRKRYLTIFIPLMVAVVVVLILVEVLDPNSQAGGSFMYVYFIFPVIFGFSMYRGLKKQRKFLMSYTVTIAGNEITREQLNTPPLTISFMEIKEIIKSEKGNFTIKGAARTDVINIPYWIEDPEELEQQLRALAPITARAKDPWHIKFRWVLTILAVAMMLAVYFLDNKIIVGISGTAVAALIIWAIYEIFTSKNLPANTKRNVWVFFIILASILYATYMKLTVGVNFH